LARKISCVLTVGYTDKSPPEIAAKYDMTRQNIYKYLAEHNNKDRNNKIDCNLYFKHFDAVKLMFENYIREQFNIETDG